MTFWFHLDTLEMARHNNTKTYNVFLPRNCMFYLSPIQSTYDDVIKWILYSERWNNYELCFKKLLFFYRHTYFMCFQFLYIRTPNWNLIPVNQLCRNRMEDVTNLSNMILLSIVVQVYNFHGKLEKLNKSFGSPQIKKVTKDIV